MINDYLSGHIDSWYCRFDLNLFNLGLYTVYPSKSKVKNNGFNTNATHTSGFDRYPIDFDVTNEQTFSFPSEITIKDDIKKQFLFRLSIVYRIYCKIRDFF